ncbi:MAG: CoA-binding protein, partial [Caldilineae bacterium]
SSPEAERLAAGAGLPYVRNRCIAVEHRRLVDG